MSEPNILIVRQHPSAFVVFILGGVVFIGLTVSGMNPAPGYVQAFMIFLGLLSIAAGIIGWKAGRIGLVLDRQGLWSSDFAFCNLTLIPWAAIQDVRKITWTSMEGEHEALLLSVDADRFPQAHGSMPDDARAWFEKTIGPLEYASPVVLSHDEWDWDLDEFLAVCQTCIADVRARQTLGEYRNSSDAQAS